jgi:phenylacetate-CoA oxygenase, PaaI subunit
MNPGLFAYCLQLADNCLILGQRNSEWTGHGPVLEQDIAITNISLDLIGQARNFYQYAADGYNSMDTTAKKACEVWLPSIWKTFNRELQEDDLAFLREERQFLNCLITELPKGDWGFSILRQFFFSSFQLLQFQELQKLHEKQLSAIAEKSLKEIAYHLQWSGEWVIRLGDGTEESKKRISESLALLWPYTGEMFMKSEVESNANISGLVVNVSNLKECWLNKVATLLEEATLTIPKESWMQKGGKDGIHTEHLGYLLAEMQYMQRTYPNLTW